MLSHDHLIYTLRCVYQDETVAKYAFSSLEGGNFSHQSVGGTKAMSLVFDALKDHYLRYDEMIGKDWLIQSMQQTFKELEEQSFTADMVQVLRGETVRVCSEVLKPIDECNAKMAMAVISEVYTNAVAKGAISAATQQAMESGNFDDLGAEVGNIKSKLVQPREPRSPLDKSKALDKKTVRSGISWFDDMINELRAGLAYGFIVPTGGGKTTFSSQLGVSAALQGNKVALLFTEQSMDESEMVDRFWALVCDKKMRDFEPYDTHEEFPDDLVSQVEKDIGTTVEKNLDVYEFSTDPGKLDDITAIAMGQYGDKPDLVIVDWAGAFAKYLMATDKRYTNSEEGALRAVADHCAIVAKRANVPILLMHQMAPSEIGSIGKVYDHTMGANCKGFCYHLAYGIVVCPKDANDFTRFDVTKGRYGANNRQVVKLEGAKSKFEAVQGYSVKGNMYKKDGQAPSIPDSNKKEKPSMDDTVPGFDPAAVSGGVSSSEGMF